MRTQLIALLNILFLMMIPSGLWSQESGAPQTSQPQQKPLPKINLQEYTIVGLEKVTLPKKERSSIFQEVALHWNKNESIWQKEPPSIAFRFSRIKPSLFRLYEYPWFDGRAHYGSFNTGGLHLATQFKARHFMPYFNVDFENSDGHQENAQFTDGTVEAGIHQQIAPGHLLHVSGQYNYGKRGIWRDQDVFPQDWDVTDNFARGDILLEEQWTGAFETRLDGGYFANTHENAFQYQENGFDGKAAAGLQIQDSRFELELSGANTVISTDPNNLGKQYLGANSFDRYEAALAGGDLSFRQQLGNLTAKVGVHYQKSRERFGNSGQKKIDDDYIDPIASLALKTGDWGELSIRYLPGAELPKLQPSVRLLPFSDFTTLRIQNYKFRLKGAYEFRLPEQVVFTAGGEYSRIGNYLAPVNVIDSLNSPAAPTPVDYPGWAYSPVEEVQIVEINGRLEWHIVPALRFSAQGAWRQSEIRKSGSLNSLAKGKEIPYLPDLDARASLGWNFLGAHWLTLSLQYLGNRYDDVLNANQLDAYLLLNARLNFQISRQVHLFLKGYNLTDAGYQRWAGFPEPGIRGYGGIKIILR